MSSTQVVVGWSDPQHGILTNKADPDVHLKPAVKPNGFECHEMILVCVDDVILTTEELGESGNELVRSKMAAECNI